MGLHGIIMRLPLAILTTLLLAGCAAPLPETTTPMTHIQGDTIATACRDGEEAHLVVVRSNPGMGHAGMFPSHRIVTRDGTVLDIHARQEDGRGVVQEGSISGGTLGDVRNALKAAGALEGARQVVITSASIVRPDEAAFDAFCDDIAPFGTHAFDPDAPQNCVDGGGSRWILSRVDFTRSVSVPHCAESGIAPYERALDRYVMPLAHTTCCL